MPMPNTPVRTSQRASQRFQRPSMEDDGNLFYFDKDKIPDGMSYEWKRYSNRGQVDVRHQSRMQRYGFTPVPAARHPEIVGVQFAKDNPESSIIVEDQILMERPAYLREEAETEERVTAKERVRHHMASLKLTPDNTMPRRGVKASKKYDIAVPGSDGSDE